MNMANARHATEMQITFQFIRLPSWDYSGHRDPIEQIVESRLTGGKGKGDAVWQLGIGN